MNESHYTGQFVPQLKFLDFIFEMAAVTLNMRSRSNRWYVPKGLVKGDQLIKKIYLYKPSAIQPFLFPIGITLEMWTLTFKSEVIGQSGLILWLQVVIDQRYPQAKFQASRSTDVKTCHHCSRTNERTNERTNRRMPETHFSMW